MSSLVLAVDAVLLVELVPEVDVEVALSVRDSNVEALDDVSPLVVLVVSLLGGGPGGGPGGGALALASVDPLVSDVPLDALVPSCARNDASADDIWLEPLESMLDVVDVAVLVVVDCASLDSSLASSAFCINCAIERFEATFDSDTDMGFSYVCGNLTHNL